MTLVRFNPVGYPVHRNLVDELFRTLGYNDTRENSNGCVPVNLKETDKSFLLELSIPGFSKDEVKISVQKNVLTIKSEKPDTEAQEGVRYLRQGFTAGNFERSFELSKHVDADQISANFRNGILEITLPKKEEILEKAPLQIEIH